MNHVTSIGLDVHARSVTAVALDSMTGEVVSKRFAYAPAEIASWILGFESPKAVYESGVTGFHLVRALRELGVDCVVGAVSKMHKPAGDRKRKNDRNDAEFLARQLMAHNVVEVFVPDEETEAAKKPLSRAGRRQRRPHPRQAPPDASPDSLGIRLGRGRRRGQETRHLDACALELDPRDRAPRGGRPGDAGLLRVPGPSRRGAEEGDREEDRPARAAAPAGATGWRPFVA